MAVGFFVLLWCTWLLTVVEVQTPPEAAPAVGSSVEAASFAVASSTGSGCLLGLVTVPMLWERPSGDLCVGGGCAAAAA